MVEAMPSFFEASYHKNVGDIMKPTIDVFSMAGEAHLIHDSQVDMNVYTYAHII